MPINEDDIHTYSFLSTSMSLYCYIDSKKGFNDYPTYRHKIAVSHQSTSLITCFIASYFPNRENTVFEIYFPHNQICTIYKVYITQIFLKLHWKIKLKLEKVLHFTYERSFALSVWISFFNGCSQFLHNSMPTLMATLQ